MVHPIREGNGRLARLLSLLIALQAASSFGRSVRKRQTSSRVQRSGWEIVAGLDHLAQPVAVLCRALHRQQQRQQWRPAPEAFRESISVFGSGRFFAQDFLTQ